MIVEIDCPCGASFEVEEDEIADDIECPECHELITVSDPEPDEDSGDAWQIETGDDDTSLIHEIGAALRYPFQGDGPYVLLSGWVIGTVFFWASAFAYVLGFLGMFLLASYLLTFLEAVTLEAAGGGKRFPQWPDAGEFLSDVFGPVWRFAIVAAASGLPYLSVMGTLELAGVQSLDPVIDHFVHGGLSLLWIFLLPMAYLTGALLGPWHAFNYVHILRSIARTAVSYILCFLVVLFLASSCLLIQFQAFDHIPLLGWCLSSLLALYLWVVLARLLGIYYYTSRRRLEWLPTR